MTDPDRGWALIVTLPEAMPVSETMELAEGLDRIGVPLQALILNRIPHDPFDDEERLALDEHLASHDHALLLGGREFRRLQRARIAGERFDRESPVGRRLRLPEYEGAPESEVVARMQADLSREEEAA
jgi:arsenite-transporting ATPase